MLLTTCPHLLRSDTPRTAVVVSGVLRIQCSLCGTVGMPARRPVYGGRKDWSVPEGGQTLYHGTAAPEFNRFREGLAYLAPGRDDASMFATNSILSRGGRKPRVLEVAAAPGRVKDVAARVTEAVMEDEDVDEIIATLAPTARNEGYRYLSFDHPGAGDRDMRVVISLYPHKDLRIRL